MMCADFGRGTEGKSQAILQSLKKPGGGTVHHFFIYHRKQHIFHPFIGDIWFDQTLKQLVFFEIKTSLKITKAWAGLALCLQHVAFHLHRCGWAHQKSKGVLAAPHRNWFLWKKFFFIQGGVVSESLKPSFWKPSRHVDPCPLLCLDY